MKEKIELNSEAIILRKEFGEDANSPIDIFSLIHNSDDLTIVFYPMSGRVSGICIRDGKNKIIGVNSTSTYGRQRFTIAHELYHLFFHEDFKSIVCSTDLEINKDPQEKEADMFASYFLIPYEALSYFVRNKLEKEKQELDIEDVIRIEQNFGISRQAILWRLINDGYLSHEKANTMKTGIIASARRLGYDDELYTPTPEDRQYVTFGKYIRLAEKLKNEDAISHGKYEELLLDGFRSDIVYGLDTEEEEVYD
ncbi:ImmA/IrrE family metallo-endopeptidase [Proteiniborus sp. MB09-C3]|uniref:ImmA/IrrE family metallo-endopeptidase n=1 Tax=Proteiniborus sp. MB09-C3 TaxID=3050072 RepID=UPI002552FEC1|nr:ImmA/IrrE family metallo-endopeptidase [Proteiniborus sp. MB09-C3]WIV12207.1 ImmA/IrrE family metallo-endopeptidase [Proteiniborus sp. MB09-C3]